MFLCLLNESAIYKSDIENVVSISHSQILELINIDFITYSGEVYLSTVAGNNWLMNSLSKINVFIPDVTPHTKHDQAVLRRELGK